MATRIETAATATDAIEQRVHEAIAVLASSRLNRFGVYINPSEKRENLRTALLAVATALKIADTTDWPTAADYEAAER
ncbi:MAG: hypothetical protein H7840_16125 [Alphaproteobacteria bacterium]